MVTELRYLLMNMRCNSDCKDCYADKKTELPQEIADAIHLYEKSNGINTISGYKAGRTNYGTYTYYSAPVVDWKSWIDKDALKKLYDWCVSYGYHSLADYIKAQM